MPTLENDTVSANLDTALGGAPSDGDTVKMIHGVQSYTGGGDWSGSDIDLVALELGPGWKGNADSTEIKVDCDQTSTGVITCGWSGQILRLQGGYNSTWYQVDVNPAQGGTVYMSSVTNFDILNIMAGSAIVRDGADPDAITAKGGYTDLLTSASNAFATLDIYSGTVRVARDGGAVNLYGGTMIAYDTTFAPTTVNNRSLIIAQRMGTAGTYNGLPGGVFDASELTEDVTFSAGTLHEGTTIILPKGGATLDYSACTLRPGAIIK